MLKFTLLILGMLVVTGRADNIFSHVGGFGEHDELLRKVLKIAAKDVVDTFDDSTYEEIRVSNVFDEIAISSK